MPGQIPPGIQAVPNRYLDEAEDDRAALRTTRRIGKEEVLAVDDKGLDTALSPGVADLQSIIQQIVQQIGFLFLQVFHRAYSG